MKLKSLLEELTKNNELDIGFRDIKKFIKNKLHQSLKIDEDGNKLYVDGISTYEVEVIETKFPETTVTVVRINKNGSALVKITRSQYLGNKTYLIKDSLAEKINEGREDFTYHSLSNPDQQLLVQIADNIMAGGQIRTDKELLIDNLKKCKVIALVKKDDDIVGIGALKIPREAYKQNVFANIDKPELANNFKYEMGYFYVNPFYRKDVSVIKGILSELHKSGTESEKIFMTIRSGGHTDKPELLRLMRFDFLGETGDNIKVYAFGDWNKIMSRVKKGING